MTRIHSKQHKEHNSVKSRGKFRTRRNNREARRYGSEGGVGESRSCQCRGVVRRNPNAAKELGKQASPVALGAMSCPEI